MASQRVLVVDDDETISEFVSMALEDEGYDVATAPHGAAALDLIDRDGEPNLILLDMRMPVMDGWQFSEHYRRRAGPHAPIVVLTAAANAAQSADQIHADAFLAKPFDLGDLLTLVGRYVQAG
jgi:CheY-like chemotaxis protein